MNEPSISLWSRVACIVGIVWLIAAIAATVADYRQTTAEVPDQKEMFGGHFIAFAMFVTGMVVAAIVLLLCFAALIHARSLPGITSGWTAIGTALAGVVIGNAAVFWAFVR